MQRQSARGLVTLLFCMILLTSATSLIFTLTRTSLAEQRIITNEYRAETLRQDCEAGLDYARVWLSRHSLIWEINAGGGYIHSLVIPANLLARPEAVELRVDYLSQDTGSPFIQIQAQASWNETGISNSLYRVRQFVHYTAINGSASAGGTIARIESVPGTWDDHE